MYIRSENVFNPHGNVYMQRNLFNPHGNVEMYIWSFGISTKTMSQAKIKLNFEISTKSMSQAKRKFNFEISN